MTSFYDVINSIKTYLQGNNSVNTVTFGDLLEVDLNKQTIFPLSHLTVRDVSFSDHTMTFTVNVMAFDIVDETKQNDKEQVEPFYGNNNKQDVLNTQLMVLNGLTILAKTWRFVSTRLHSGQQPYCNTYRREIRQLVSRLGNGHHSRSA